LGSDLVVDLAVDSLGDISANLDVRRFCALWIGGRIHHAEPATIAEELRSMHVPVPGAPLIDWTGSVVEAMGMELDEQ
jgi:hypothetical protein